MNIKELRKKDAKQLKKDLLEFRKEQFNLRFQAANSQLEKTSRVRVVRRSIARIKTLLNATSSAK